MWMFVVVTFVITIIIIIDFTKVTYFSWDNFVQNASIWSCALLYTGIQKEYYQVILMG